MTKPLTEELKACPFCGSGAQFNYVDYIGDNFVDQYSVMCMNSNCETQPDTILYKNKAYAAKAWNTRQQTERNKVIDECVEIVMKHGITQDQYRFCLTIVNALKDKSVAD